MTPVDREERPPSPKGLAPELPGGRLGQLVILAALCLLIAVDELGLHGALFHRRWWHIALWLITVAGLVLGAAFHLRRFR